MTEEQLMINDLVTLVVTTYNDLTDKEETSNHPARITDISPTCSLCGVDGDCCIFAHFLDGYDVGSYDFQIEPIPLTAEILKANEFELDTPCKMLYQPQEVNGIPNISGRYQYVEVTFRRDEIYKIEIHNSWNNIEYGVVLRSTVMVHELQHALRLCNLNDIADNFKLQQL